MEVKVIKIPKSRIDGDTIHLHETPSTLGRFLDDGIEIEKCLPVTFATIDLSFLDDTEYRYALLLLRHLEVKIIKIPENKIHGNTLIIDKELSILGRFLQNDIAIEKCSSITSATIGFDLDASQFKYATQVLRYLKLKRSFIE